MRININDLYDEELKEDFYVLARRYLISQDINPDKFIIDIDITCRQKQDIKTVLVNSEVKE